MKQPKAFDVKKILLPIDFSETSLLAIEHGAFMAKLYKADLVLLHVLEKSWQKFNIIAPEIKFELPPNIMTAIEDKLKELGEKIRKEYGVSSTVISTEGNICDEIVSLSKNDGIDLVVMGTHGSSGFEEIFIGSNSYKVVTLSECPILTVQTHARRVGFAEICLPIDNSNHSRQKINHAVAIAKKYGARLNIVGLLDEADSEDIAKFNIKIEQVEQYIQKCDIPFTSVTKIVANQAKETLNFAKQHNMDLIVIMTDQEENFTGSFLGPYAQQVVNHSWIPVLSIKPIEHPENLSWVHPY